MRTIYGSPAEFRRNSQHAHTECLHGVRMSDCNNCVRYAGECDMGGCTRRSSLVAVNGSERRPICKKCASFARSLGMSVA